MSRRPHFSAGPRAPASTPAQRRLAALGADTELAEDTDPGPDSDAGPGPYPDPGPDPYPDPGPDPAADGVTGWVPDRDSPPHGDQEAKPPLASRLARSGTWGVLAEKWVPDTLREARVSPGRRGATVLTLVAALAAVVAAIGVWWTRPQPVPSGSASAPVTVISGAQGTASGYDAPASAADRPDAGDSGPRSGPASGTAPTGAAPPSAVPAGPIVVSVTGHVRHPGLVSIPAGSRVADAIAAAGGAVDQADLTGLNLAARLADGSSVVIADSGHSRVDGAPKSSDGGGPATGESSGAAGPVNINRADSEALQGLPGVGPVTAAAIVSYREEHGAFTSVQELQAVSGIGPATLARLAPHVTT